MIEVASVTGISTVTGAGTAVDVYTTGGILLRNNVGSGKALDGLAPGVYIVNGGKW